MKLSTQAQFTFLLALCISEVLAHMQMSKPYPIRSPLNPNSTAIKDYSYTNPLQASGADYPCKGFANDPFISQQIYVPGSSYETEIEGNADHGGGSCQLALTYDKGQSFKVLLSVEGGCGINKKWIFGIPKDAPHGEALFVWTWFNKVGNREMYMNCAMVTINATEHLIDRLALPIDEGVEEMKAPTQTGGPLLRSANTSKESRHATDANTFEFLPELFVANVNGEGKCVTIEGEDVGFPVPGPNVIGKSNSKGYKCSEDASFLDGGDK